MTEEDCLRPWPLRTWFHETTNLNIHIRDYPFSWINMLIENIVNHMNHIRYDHGRPDENLPEDIRDAECFPREVPVNLLKNTSQSVHAFFFFFS